MGWYRQALTNNYETDDVAVEFVSLSSIDAPYMQFVEVPGRF